MPFTLVWLLDAKTSFDEIESAALKTQAGRVKSGKTKASRQEGLYKQIAKCLTLLATNPRHPGLNTHVLAAINHPYSPGHNVFEAYAQNNTPGAYRVFCCYGPGKNEITIIAITPHP